MLSRTSSPVTQPQTDLDMARLLYDRGEFADAAALSKHVYEESEDPEQKVRALLLASSCGFEQRRYAAALKTLNLACAFIDEVAPRWKASFYGLRGLLNAKLTPQDNDSGLIDYSAALQFAQEAGDEIIEARTRNNLAKRYSDVGRLDEGLKEVDTAIAIAERLKEWILVGRFCGLKAQILVRHNFFKKALTYSEKAIRLLDDHSALAEARTTHGRALAGLAAEFLEQEDPIDTFTGKRDASKYLSVSLDAKLIQLALDRTNNNLLHASELLHIKHPSLLQLVKKFKLARKPIRRRGKSHPLK